MRSFQSSTVFVSISLVCLPILVFCGALCLPFFFLTIALLYLSAWATYFTHGRTDAIEFKLPLHPFKILKVNYILLSMVTDWFSYLPLIVSFLYWRYWKLGTEHFKKMTRIDIQYSNESPTTKLDVYMPEKTKTDGPAPIILFVYGGAWSSGSKFIYTTTANSLRELGYVVVVPDYRKYPEVKIDPIYRDIREAIKWTHAHAAEIGGDPDLIYLMGHSAGAHLATQVVLSDVIEKAKYQESFASKNSSSSSPNMNQKHDSSKSTLDNDSDENLTAKTQDFLPQVEGLLLFSGVYEIASHLIHETNRGIEELSAMARVMGSSVEGFRINSPIHLLEDNAALLGQSEAILDLWPRILIVHGQVDITVGFDQSSNLFNTIGKLLPVEHRKEVDVRMRLHKRMGHGEPVISLMYNPFADTYFRNLLLGDIQEFIDPPSAEEEEEEEDKNH